MHHDFFQLRLHGMSEHPARPRGSQVLLIRKQLIVTQVAVSGHLA